MKPESFVPAIIQHLDRPKPWIEWIDGTILFADISGFTPMAEALSSLGAEGAEILTTILNRYFAETIEIIHSQGGETMKFGGDALMCLFHGANAEQRAIAAAASIQSATSKYRNIKTPIKKFVLQVKIGIASGPIMIAGVGDPSIRSDYLLAGNTVDKSVQAERTAGPGETVIASQHDESFKNLKSAALHSVFSQSQKYSQETAAQQNQLGMSHYVISEIYEMIRLGYDHFVGALLNSVPAFLEFTGFNCEKGQFQLDHFHDFFNQVTASAHRFGGRLNGVMMGDKGNNFLFYFGAPSYQEKKERVAIEWSLEIRGIVRRLFPNLSIKIGITEGKVFSGIVGGSGRYHYAVVGDCVNLAARLTQIAKENQICVSQNLQEKENSNFLFDELGAHRVKGKAKEIQIYSVTDQASQKLSHEHSSFYGRTNEIGIIQRSMGSSFSGKPSVLILEARAGVGKSALCEEILESIEADALVLRGSSEITRKNHPYACWQNIFKSLQLTPSVVFHENSFLSQEQKKELHHELSKELLKSIANRKTVMVLEDLHWFDSLSLEFLGSLLNHLLNETIFILATARPEWEKSDFIHRPICNFLTLREFDKSATAKVSEEILGGPIKNKLLDFLYSSSQGNHFLLENLLRYLTENEFLLKIDGEWTVKHDANLKESLSGEELVAAQIERLSLPARIHLQIAACMGPTFSLSILRSVLGKKFRKPIYKELCQSGYFQDSEEEWTSFQQGLIQEAIYYSLPQKRRRRIHRKIGNAMETILHNEKSRFYPNLANHFKLAGVRDKALFYSLAASEKLVASQSYREASHYLETAYLLSKNTSDPRKWNAGLKLAEAFIYSGNIEKSFQISDDLRTRARRRKLRDIFYAASALHFDAMRRKSDYSFLPAALKIVKNSNSKDPQNESKILQLAGSAYFWLGQPDKAEPLLKQSLGFHQQKQLDDVAISSYVFLANICADRGQKDEASKWIDEALGLANKNGSKYQAIRIRHEWAGILSDTGEPEKAVKILNELIPQAETVGDYYLVGAILITLANAEIRLNYFDDATEHVDEAAILFNNMGMLHGYAHARMLAGALAFYRNNYAEAFNLYKEATEFFEKAGENLEVCYGYYNLAEVCWKEKKKDDAEVWLSKGMKSFDSKNNPNLAKMYDELKRELNHEEHRVTARNPKHSPQ